MDDQDFNLRAIVGILKRQYLVVALTVCVVVGVTTIVVLSLSPIYRATTLVLVDPSDKNLLEPSSSALSGAAENARIESEVIVAKSETTLEMVISELRLSEDTEFQPRPSIREQALVLLGIATAPEYSAEAVSKYALRALRSAISVNRQGSTYLLEISARARTPEKAALIANAMARMYVRAQLQSKVNSVLAGRDVLADRVMETRAELVTAEQAFNDFILSSAAAIAESTGRGDLDQLRVQLESLVQTRERVSAQLELAEAGLAQENWGQVASQLDSQTLRELQVRHDQLQQELADVLNGSDTADDLRRELLATVDNIRATATTELSQLRRTIADQRAREADLQLQLRSAILASSLPAEVLASMYDLQQNAEITRAQYQQVLGRLRDIEAQAYLQIADSRIASEATPPSSAFFPNVNQSLLLAALGGLVAGLALAFIRENYVGGIVEAEQLENLSETTQVTTVPEQSRLSDFSSGKLSSVAQLITEHPYSAFTEAVRRLMVIADQTVRKRNSERPNAGNATVILVTSANANEGKTTLATSLARVYALTGRSTVIIDADTRQPNVHNVVGLESSHALARYLNTNKPGKDIAQVLQRDPLTSARVIASGDSLNFSAGQVVSTEAFLTILDRAIKDFEVVVIDTPPVGAVVDALYLAQFADVLINVVKYRSTTYREVRSAMRELSEALHPHACAISVLSAQPQSKSENRRRFGEYYVQ